MNYFLNNPIPTAAEVMRGFARGGEVDSELGDLAERYGIEDRFYAPRDEGETVVPSAAPAPARYDEKGNLLPSADSPLAQMSGGVPQWVKMRELFGGTPSLIPDLVTAGSGGKDLTIGDLYKTKREQAVKDYETKVQRFKDAGEFNPDIDESLKSMLNMTLEGLGKEEVDYLNQLPQRQTLSNLLRENKFKEAYKFAQDNGMQTLLFRGDQLKNLREPFTKDEAKAFMREMPFEFFKSAYGDQYEFDKAFKFDPEGAESRGALNWIAFDQSGRPMISETGKPTQSDTGYPMLERIFELKEVKKDTGIFEKIFKVAAIGTALFGGAQLLGALSTGAAGAGAAGAGTAGTTGGGFLGGLKAAGKTVLGIPETIGKTVAAQLGAGAVKPVTAKMIGNAIISGGVTGAKGGDLEDVLKSAAMAAGLTFVSDKVISSVAQKLQDSRLMDAVQDIPGGDVAAVDPTVASTIADSVTKGLENFAGDITVSTFAPSAAVAGLQNIGALGAAQAAVSPGEQLAPEEDLLAGDITISTGAPDFGAGLETGAYTGYQLASDAGVGAEEPFEPAETVEGQQEIEVTGEGDQVDITDPTIQAIMDQMPFEPAPYDPLTGTQEIEITTAPEGLDMSDPLTQVLLNRYIDVQPTEPIPEDLEEFTIETDRDLDQGFLEYAPPVFAPVNPADIMKGYQPTKVETPFERLLSKYGTMENLLKLAGAVGTGTGAEGTGAPTAPAYDPRTSATAGPWIDWEKVKADAAAAGMNLNTYTARNWNQIQNRALEAGLGQPVTPEYNPEQNIMDAQGPTPKAQGGLMGYEDGGRYVDGPGSGRDDKIPALLSDGEYVIDAETLALLGDGSTKEGARKMDEFRSNIRKHKGATLAKGGISPNAKSPLQYLRKI